MNSHKPKSPPTRPRRDSRHADLATDIKLYDEEDLGRMLADSQADALVLVLDGLQDPQNLGACLRSADAAGVSAVIFPKDRAVGLTSTVRSIASGAAESLRLIQVTNLARSMITLKECGFWLVGAADEADKSLYDADLTGRLAMVMGAEGKGLRRLTRDRCDYLVSIPMRGSVSCLNVSAATAVCLFEAVRQRLSR